MSECGEVSGNEEKGEYPQGRAISFVVRLRSGGGSGKSKQLTIPKDVSDYLGLKNGDFVRCALHRLDKKKRES